ncbi:MAG TPA: sensor histidine kinase [Salegentibacter sp.]|nr:sensor histidine kinase [Salegentibacter sp.]
MVQAAEIINNNQAEIMDAWEERVLKEIPAAKTSSNLALRNQLPNVLDDIADILKRHQGFLNIAKDEKYEEIIKNSLDHGRHRATTSNYTVKQILKEYVIFHRVLTELLLDNKVYNEEVGIILKYTLETAMLNSASSFNDSMQEMREKLIGTLAHDIRNPISTAYFALQIIDPNADEKRIEDLKKMGLRSLDKSLELVEGLLDAISVKAGEGITLNFEEINLAKEVKWVANEASEIYTNEINFESNAEEISGIFDGTAIRRVVENLVTNAVKYGSRNSAVSIRLEDSPEEAYIKVHNFGKAISEENKTDIFKFLNRGKKSTDSTLESWGMGLTLVETVAKAHGGKVHLESTDEGGTTFAISLKKSANSPGKVRTKLNYIES